MNQAEADVMIVSPPQLLLPLITPHFISPTFKQAPTRMTKLYRKDFIFTHLEKGTIQYFLQVNHSRLVIKVMKLVRVQVEDAVESIWFWDVEPPEVESLVHSPGSHKPAVAAAEVRPDIV